MIETSINRFGEFAVVHCAAVDRTSHCTDSFDQEFHTFGLRLQRVDTFRMFPSTLTEVWTLPRFSAKESYFQTWR